MEGKVQEIEKDGKVMLAFSTREMAKMFAVSVDTVRRWIREERFPAFKGPNGRLYVEWSDAMAWANTKWGDG